METTIVFNKKVARRKMSRTKVINTVRFFWWLKEVIKEWTVKCAKGSLEKFGIFLVFSYLILSHLYKKSAPVLGAIYSVVVWVLVHLVWVVWFLTAGIILGKNGTKKLLDKKSRSASELKWINVDPVPVCIWGACLLLLSLIIIPKAAVFEPIEQKSVAASVVAEEDNEGSKTLVPMPRQARESERYYFTYDFNEVNYDESKLSITEQEYLILCVQHECGHTGSIFLNCNDFGFIQRALAKSFLNQRKNLGQIGLLDTISDTQIFGSLKPEIDEIYTILKNGGDTKDLMAAGIANPEAYDLSDKVTINNVNTVIYGLDDVPENALFWRNEDGFSAEEAYVSFLSNYDSSADLTNYLSVMVKSNVSPYGYYWMLFVQDNNFQE